MEISSLPGDFPPTPTFIPITAVGASTGRWTAPTISFDKKFGRQPGGMHSWL